MVAFSVAGGVGAAGLYRALSRRLAPVRVRVRAAPALVALLLYLVYAAALFHLMPAGSDARTLPADLTQAFRGLSLGGLVLFWLVLAGTFGWLARGAQRSAG
jgi:hypothetical protein